MKRILFVLLSFSCVFMGLIAQEDTTKVLNLDEIVVSSLYTQSNTLSNTIKSEELVDKNYGQEPSHFFTKMPSIVSTNDNGTEYGYGYYRIRGLDQTRINVTLDGCPWNEAEDYGAYFANSPDLLSSLSSIKIERGTASSYNGIAGVAGGIMMESVNLYKDTTSLVSFSGGNLGTMKGTVVYNMGNINGWGLHIKGTHQQTDGYRDFGFNKSEALTIKFGYKFNPTTTIDVLSMNGYHRNGQGWIGNTLEELQINPYANGNTEAETDNWFMSMNRIQYKQLFTNTALIASVYYQFQDGSYRFDLDNFNARMIGIETNTKTIYDYGLTHHMIGANVSAKHYLNSVNISYGINGYKFMRKHFMKEGVNVSMDEYYNNMGIKNDFSIFANITYQPLPQLSLSGNVQYRHANFDYIDYVNTEMSFKNNKQTIWDFCNFGFNIEYLPISNLKIYAKYNQVHREPTRSDMFGGNEYFIGELNTIKPEIANDVEIGVEYKNEKIYANANLYYMFFKNELILNGLYGTNGLPCHDNVEQSSRKGIELTFNWNFVTNWHIKSAFSWSDNTIKIESLGKKKHILTPEITWNGDICYETNKFNVGVNTQYRSEVFVNIENTNKIPYLLTVNAYAKYKINNNFHLEARVNNITNRVNYYTGAIGPNGETLYFRNAGTTFNIGIKYNF